MQTRENFFKMQMLHNIFPSIEMREYYFHEFDNMSDYGKAELIGGSLIPIRLKLEYAKQYNLNDLIDECNKAISNLERKDDEIFYLFKHDVNHLHQFVKENSNIKDGTKENDILNRIDLDFRIFTEGPKFGVMPILDYNFALRYIKDDIRKEVDYYESYNDREEYNNFIYYKLEKWKKIDKEKLDMAYFKEYCRGDMYKVCEYYIANEEIVFYKGWRYDRKVPTYSNEILRESRNLNIQIPFKAGDIVKSIMTPFMENRNMLLLKIGDNCDCCSVQAAYVDEWGNLCSGALKHANISYNWVSPIVSPLYSLTSKKVSLKENENILIELKEKMNGDEEKGREILDKIRKESDKRISELRKVKKYGDEINERKLMLTGNWESDDGSFCKSVCDHINYLEEINQYKEIRLRIGGLDCPTTEALGIYATMKCSNVPISTVCISETSGVATLLLAAGDKGKRYALPDTKISLYYDPKANIIAKNDEEKEIQLKHINDTTEHIYAKLAENTGRTIEEIKEIAKPGNYMTPKEARIFGIIDEIIEKTY